MNTLDIHTARDSDESGIQVFGIQMVTVPGHEVHNICKHILEVRGPEFVPLHHPQTEARDFHPLWSDFQPKITKYIFKI